MATEIYTPIGTSIETFTITGTRKAFFQSGSGDYLGCRFTISELGPESVTLFFAKFANIEERDIIKIKCFNSDEYFFTGVIRQVPLSGSTKAEYNYRGYGFADYFLRLNTLSKSYSTTTVGDIVDDLIDTVITPNSPITKNTSKIDALNISVSSMALKYISIKDAMTQLKNIANSDGNDYLVGVDTDGDFFFKARDTETLYTLQVGKTGRYGIEAYQPKQTKEPKSKLHVLRNDGTFYKTYTSTEDIDIYEEKVNGPDIADGDLDNWAEGQLALKEELTREANVEWQMSNNLPELVVADGSARILSATPPVESVEQNVLNYGEGPYGGGPYGGFSYSGLEVDDTLKVKKVTYTINDKNATMKIQLGFIPVELDTEVLMVNKKVEDLKISLGR